MKRRKLLPLIFVFFVFFVDHTVVVRSAPQAKLSRDELALRQQKINDDPIGLLELCPLADETMAQKLRGLAGKLLMEAPVATRADLAHKVALVLAEAARTPDEVHQILGLPQKVSRQIVYSRFLEQWTYDHTLALSLVWSMTHGRMHLQSVRANTNEKL
jgi:hypothetical protein